jgi:type IV pilus assembly protein PilO
MQIELDGRFHQLAKFFYNVGQLERIINMENIALTTPTVIDQEIRLKAKVLATAFHAVEEETDAAGPASRKRRDRAQ